MRREYINKKSGCRKIKTAPICPYAPFITLILIFFLDLFLGGLSFAQKQGQPYTDSLLAALQAAGEDTAKVKTLFLLSDHSLQNENYNEALNYSSAAKALAQKLNFKSGIADADIKTGWIYYIQHKYYEALEKYYAALKMYEAIGDKESVAFCNKSIGDFYFIVKKYPESQKKYEAALNQYKELGDKQGMAQTYGTIGNIYFFQYKDYAKTMEMFNAMLNIEKELGDTAGIASVYNGFASVYAKQHNYSEAVKSFQTEIKLLEKLGDNTNLLKTYIGLGMTYADEMGNYPEALNAYFKAKKIAEEMHAERFWPGIYRNIGDAYTRQGMAAESKPWLQKALAFAKEKGYADNLQRAYASLSEADSALGNYKSAYQYYKLSMQYKDSVLSDENTKRLAQTEMQNEFDKNDAVSKARQEKKDIIVQKELQRQKLLRNGFIGGFVVVLLFAGIFLQQRNKIKKEQQRAEQSEKFKQQFLANMSHEIRTPMNAVMGMTALMLNTPLNAKQRNYLNSINKASENLLHIINEILDLSKIEAGKIALEHINFSIRDVTEQVKQTLQQKAIEKNIELIITVAGNVPEILIGDPVRLFQVLMNLVGNAIKFTEKGSVQLTVNKAQEQIHFSITDTGIGIPQDKLEKIFESFSQAQASDTRLYGGTGLGLSISKQLVELMGGSIAVESESGSGTTFSFAINLPLGSKENLLQQHQLKQVDGSILNGLKILVVDDNEENRIVCRDTLQSKANVEIVEATNGKEALEKLLQHHFDIVLMDVQMPVMDGYEATQQIRNHFDVQKKGIPVIALTASVIRSDLDKCRAAGMNDYVPKPFKPSQLFSAIANLTKREIKYLQVKEPAGEMLPKGISKNADLTYLENFCEGDKIKMQKYMRIFLDSVPLVIARLNTALKVFDAAEIAAQVHGFKTKFVMMGMEEARVLAAQLEADCRSESPEQTAIRANTQTLIQLIVAAETEVKNTIIFTA